MRAPIFVIGETREHAANYCQMVGMSPRNYAYSQEEVGRVLVGTRGVGVILVGEINGRVIMELESREAVILDGQR